MQKLALISDDTKYRYQLSRIWDDSKPRILFIMLNPSTADSNNDDPTIRRVIGFAKLWGYGGLHVGNLYAYRSTDPKALKEVADPVGKENITHIQSLIRDSDRVVYAWGNNKSEPAWLKELVPEPYCIDVSKYGIPKHPLYLKSDLTMRPFTRLSS
jgi:hypothetical protein